MIDGIKNTIVLSIDKYSIPYTIVRDSMGLYY